jgi:hypothetical protein
LLPFQRIGFGYHSLLLLVPLLGSLLRVTVQFPDEKNR